MAKDLISISPVEFANRFASGIRDQDQRFTWFFGAGCSISSGIPAAGGLVEKWLRELQDLQKLPKAKFDAWVQTEFAGFDSRNPAKYYAKVFGRTHLAPADRQREIERICADGEPSYGYATFAQLLSLKGIGERCNTVLTTNFDDLIADALYMYGERRMRPQIITHEALARYVRIASPRPTIIKLHGDAHLDPRNLVLETSYLNSELTSQIYPFVQGSALIFIGYGGNDESIFRFFKDAPIAALAQQIYWVGKHDPATGLRDWLAEKNAIRVEHTDFDRLMHHLRGPLQFGHPEATRWERNYKRYLEQYKTFEDEVKKDPESEEKAALQQASHDASSSLPTDWEYYVRVTRAKDADEKERLYEEAIAANPDSALLMDGFAGFLNMERNDADRAEVYYKRAIEADPTDADNLGNYAYFLRSSRKDLNASEKLYQRTIKVNPVHPNNLANYSQLLFELENNEEALDVLKRALEVAYDPTHLCELLFYQLAHSPEILVQQDSSLERSTLTRLKELLEEGHQSIDWDFSKDIVAAEKNGHSKVELLRDLARVISENAPVSILIRHEAWRAA